MISLSEKELAVLAEKYCRHALPSMSRRLAKRLADTLDPMLEAALRLWLQTGEEQPFTFVFKGESYSLRSVQLLLECDYLTALERMNDFVTDPMRNYYRIVPC